MNNMLRIYRKNNKVYKKGKIHTPSEKELASIRQWDYPGW